MKSGLKSVGLLLICALAGFSLVAVARLSSSPGRGEGSQDRVLNGSELVAIAIGSAGCAVCSSREMPKVLQRSLDEAEAVALAEGWGFARMGVSLDQDIGQGLALLEKWGEFDVISVGGGWLNAVAVRYLWGEFPGPGVVPQIVLLRREVYGPPLSAYAIDGEVVVGRFVGLDEIREMTTRIHELDLSRPAPEPER